MLYGFYCCALKSYLSLTIKGSKKVKLSRILLIYMAVRRPVFSLSCVLTLTNNDRYEISDDKENMLGIRPGS